MGRCQITDKSLKAAMDIMYKDVLGKAKQNIDKADSEIEELGKKISSLLRLKEEANTLYMAYSNQDTTLIQNQLEQIADLPKVDLVKLEVKSSSSALVVTTNTLYCTVSNGGTYLLGEYKIAIKLGTSSIVIKNLDEKNRRYSYWGEGCQHPHINPSGQACFGNIRELLAQLCQEHQYMAIVDILINFLESANLNDSAGHYAANWDLVDPVTKEVIYGGVGATSGSDLRYDNKTWKKDRHNRKITCMHCKRVISDGDVVQSPEGPMHTQCFNQMYRQCQHCEKIIKLEDTFIYGSNFFCQEHKDIALQNYKVCSHCGKLKSTEQMIAFYDSPEEYICKTGCKRNYETVKVGRRSYPIKYKIVPKYHDTILNVDQLDTVVLDENNEYILKIEAVKCPNCEEYVHVQDSGSNHTHCKACLGEARPIAGNTVIYLQPIVTPIEN